MNVRRIAAVASVAALAGRGGSGPDRVTIQASAASGVADLWPRILRYLDTASS